MKLLEDSLDLINHKQELLEAAIAGQETLQKALAKKEREIDDLKVENRSLRIAANFCEFHYNKAKADAIKEFADLAIKAICEKVSAPTPTESYIVEKCIEAIDNIVKEMVGDAE